eukprot:2891951-Pyramimonas_sp.AAC.1
MSPDRSSLRARGWHAVGEVIAAFQTGSNASKRYSSSLPSARLGPMLHCGALRQNKAWANGPPGGEGGGGTRPTSARHR